MSEPVGLLSAFGSVVVLVFVVALAGPLLLRTVKTQAPYANAAAGSVLAWLSGGVFAVFALVLLSRGLQSGVGPVFFGTFFALCAAVAWFPWALASTLTIPLGLVRASAFLARLAQWTWGLDPDGGAAIAAVRAARRWPRAGSAQAVEQVLAHVDNPGGAACVAQALWALSQGDVERARALFAFVAAFDARAVPPLAQRMAIEWRAADLAARGAWRELSTLPPGRSRRAELYVACAAVLSGAQKNPDPAHLYRLWWMAPSRRLTQPLVERALAPLPQPPARRESTSPPRPAAEQSASRAALSAYRAVVQSVQAAGEVQAADVATVARAWSVELSSGLRERLKERARVLGISDAAGAVADAVASIEAAVAELAADVDFSAHGSDDDVVLHGALERVRSGRLDAIEVTSLALLSRAQTGRDLPPLLELQEAAMLLAHYRACKRTGLQGALLGLDGVEPALSEQAVRLWNLRKQKKVANAIFRVLVAEATALDQMRLKDTHTKNAACGF